MNPSFFFVLSGLFLGWSLGANDAANVFGTAVGTKVIKWSTAVTITAVAVIAGAVHKGQIGIANIGSYAALNSVTTGLEAFIVMLVAALTVTGFTILKFPVSTTQCIVGSMIGWGLSKGTADFSKTTDFFSAWLITPLGSCLICFILCKLFAVLLEKKVEGHKNFDMVVKIGYMASGAFGAYSLGANNVANATGIYLSVDGVLNSTFVAALAGGIAIALGVLTFSKPVMQTVGEGVTSLSPVMGFLAVISCSIIVYIYALIGIPVSTSQAIVGAVIGAGLTKGVGTVKFDVLKNIGVAWFLTPLIPGFITFVIGKIIVT